MSETKMYIRERVVDYLKNTCPGYGGLGESMSIGTKKTAAYPQCGYFLEQPSSAK